VQIVGVIDLKDGMAVHAKGGHRHLYQPVATCAGARVDGDPIALARIYVEDLGLSRLYVADLNAIESRAPQTGTLRRLHDVGATLLVDAGISTGDAAEHLYDAGADAVVIGLETLPSMAALMAICAVDRRPNLVFSLDLRDGIPVASDEESRRRQPEAIATCAAAAGVDEMIVLDLARVGAGLGPPLEVCRRIRAAAPDLPLLVGGGIRGMEDLSRLHEIECAGALVATAFHEGRLTARDLAALR
jgi:HisA/HisF family protein